VDGMEMMEHIDNMKDKLFREAQERYEKFIHDKGRND
jgi:hypothetical protein